MIDSFDRLKCFDYLLDEMDEESQLRFEARLSFDGDLRNELKQCEEELALFAEASTPMMSPPSAVWDGILKRIEDSVDKASPKARLAKSVGKLKWRSLAWPLAASVLIAFNVAQFFSNREDQRRDLVQSESDSIELARDQVEAIDALPSEVLREEIYRLQTQIVYLNRRLEEAESGYRLVQELDTLRKRRDELEERIESLEVNYLSLVTIADDLGESENLKEIEDGLGVDLAHSVSMLEGKTGVGFWDRIDERLGDRDLVLLSFDSVRLEANISGYFSSSAKSPEVARSIDAYALAFADIDSRKAIISLGGLPAVQGNETLTLWAVEEETGRYTRIGNLPMTNPGGSMDVAFKIPGGPETVNDYVVSIELIDEAPSPLPSERIVIETIPGP